MSHLSCRRFALFPIFVLVVGTLFRAQPVAAQSEGLEIEHSPNAKRALRLHAEKRAELVSQYHQSIELPAERFAKTCERHIDRYIALLDREMRTLRRKGLLDEAKAVQAAIQRAEGWTISSPDSEGVHFLTKENLEVTSNEKATKLGVDLQVNVEKATELYNKQAQVVFDQYKAKVDAARSALQDELAKTLEIEQRAGRLEAVQEVQAAIGAVKKLPEALRPEPALSDQSQSGPHKASLPHVGFYLISYDGGSFDDQKFLIQLTEEGGVAHRRFNSYGRDDWHEYNLPIEIASHKKNKMVLTHVDHITRRDIVHVLMLNEEGVPFLDHAYADQEACEKGYGRSQGAVHRMGSPGTDLLGLEDGKYILAMDMQIDQWRRARRGTFSIKLEIVHGIIYRTHFNTTQDPEKWTSTGMEFFEVTVDEKKLMLEYDKAAHHWTDYFEIEMTRRGNPKVNHWWRKDGHDNGEPPHCSGKLVRVEDE